MDQTFINQFFYTLYLQQAFLNISLPLWLSHEAWISERKAQIEEKPHPTRKRNRSPSARKEGIQREQEEGDQRCEDTDSPKIQLVWVGLSKKLETLDKLRRKVGKKKLNLLQLCRILQSSWRRHQPNIGSPHSGVEVVTSQSRVEKESELVPKCSFTL